MAIVDDRGRLLGRFNVVDVFVFILVVVMIPMAYAAYALFRAPAAKLTGVEPKQLTMAPSLRVRINGRNLRPFMRVSFNTVQGRTFMIGSTETAEIDLPDLEPGDYDVVLTTTRRKSIDCQGADDSAARARADRDACGSRGVRRAHRNPGRQPRHWNEVLAKQSCERDRSRRRRTTCRRHADANRRHLRWHLAARRLRRAGGAATRVLPRKHRRRICEVCVLRAAAPVIHRDRLDPAATDRGRPAELPGE